MTSSISWIDTDGLASTLARIGVRSGRGTRADRRIEAPPLDSAPVESPPVTAPPEVTTGPVRVEPIQVAEAEVPEIPAYEPPEGPLRTRLRAFMDWLVEITGCRVAFIVDRDGLPLIDREADPDLLAIASSVMQLIDSINGKLLFHVGKAVTLDLSEDQLILVSVNTPIGKYIVGQVGEHAMHRDLQSAMSDALRRAFRPDDGIEAAEG